MSRGLTHAANDVIILLRENQNQAMSTQAIAYALKKSEQATNNILRRLSKHGLVESHPQGIFKEYTLTQTGINAYQRVLNVYAKKESKRVSITTSLNTSGVYVRLHALALKVPLKNPFTSQEIALLVSPFNPKPKPMQGHTDQIFQFNGITFKLTTSSLIAYANQAVAPLEQQIPALTDQAVSDTLNAAYALETQMQASNGYFKLVRHTHTINNQKDFNFKVIELHIAITNDEFAKQATAEKDPYLIAMSDVDASKESLIADKSIKVGVGKDKKGIPEVEGISKEVLPNKQPEAMFNTENIRRFYEAIGKQYYDPFEQEAKIAQTIDLLQHTSIETAGLAQEARLLAENQNTHIPLIAEAKETLKSNNELMAAFLPVLKEYLAVHQAKPSESLLRKAWKRIWGRRR